MRSGYKTTEFWLTLMVALAGTVLVVYGVIAKEPVGLEVGVNMIGIPMAGYTISRGVTKAGSK